jgi:hypothetical protein
MTRMPPRPDLEEVRAFCQRVRSAGSPKAVARPRLVADYQRIATALGVVPVATPTGEDLQRASVALLREAGRPVAAPARARAAVRR